jgi:type II secretory pathway component PulK
VSTNRTPNRLALTFCGGSTAGGVAQSFTLPYRRVSPCWTFQGDWHPAECNSAKQQSETLRYGRGRQAQGFVLVAVLVVVMLLSMVAVSLMFRLKADEAAMGAGGRTEQAWAAAMSGVEEAMRAAGQARTGSAEWQDSPQLFRDRLVSDDGADRWFFTVYSAADPESREEVRYGLTDEAGKLNVNQATETNLMKLPRMTLSVAEALCDFIDSDNTPRPEGAEQEYYDALPNPYKIRNGPLATLDEMLLVRGITPALFYGEDVNLNLVLDPNENDGDQTFPPDDSDGKLDLGWRQYLTVSAFDLNEARDGTLRVNLNDPDDPLPPVDFPAALTNYIDVLRTNKITLAHPADLLEARTKVKDASGREVEIGSGVGKSELPLVMDLFTTAFDERLPGLINVNSASVAVLATVPGLEEPLAESIVSARRGLSPEKRSTTAWLYTEGLVSAEVFKQIAPHLTSRGFQFSFHVIGYGVPSGRYRVLEAVVDCAGEKPTITYLRDLTRFGLPLRIQSDPGQSGQSTRAGREVGRG